MPRKKVRVTVEIDYPLTFLALLDIYSVHLVETSVSEAAAMDVVLVIDVSESMTWDKDPDPTKNYWEDPANPHVCNVDNSCEPFAHVKAAAADFAAKILDRADPLDEEDRLAIVTFASGWEQGAQGTMLALNWTNDRAVALGAINGVSGFSPGLQVYDPGVPQGICPFGEYGCPGGINCPATTSDIPTGACIAAVDTDLSTGIKAYDRLKCARIGRH